MPAEFPYRETALAGRPRHRLNEAFSARHPPMPPARWAKIFAPFDALRGFGEAIAAKQTRYIPRPEPACGAAELSRRLRLLQALAPNGRLARARRVPVTARYFRLCSDPESPSFGREGSCESCSGLLLGVDRELRRVLWLQTPEGRTGIPLEDLLELSSPALPETARAADAP